MCIQPKFYTFLSTAWEGRREQGTSDMERPELWFGLGKGRLVPCCSLTRESCQREGELPCPQVDLFPLFPSSVSVILRAGIPDLVYSRDSLPCLGRNQQSKSPLLKRHSSLVHEHQSGPFVTATMVINISRSKRSLSLKYQSIPYLCLPITIAICHKASDNPSTPYSVQGIIPFHSKHKR